MSLSTEQWSRLEELFAQALALPAADRPRYLDEHCPEPRLRRELDAMLATDTGDGWLAPVRVSTTAEGMAPMLAPGTRLGAWQIRSLIGHGGMGEVYLADRADGAFVMQSAIKLLKSSLVSDRNAERFLRERHVLARLSHTNIARVLDAGATADGRPYLVMEYVRGQRITDYARAQAMPPRAMAALMQAVAEAVAEAHRQRVVHRDLKPANVLVTDEGQVKLLDFGIARIMDEADTRDSLPMTLPYAAPEQILGREPVPATDVYALGVMLFQLLTQRLPHRREGLPLPVIAASLRDETVERPSRVVRNSEGLLGTVERLRQAEALTGDLDWIVLKALQADPARRYQSAGELANDLQRHLEHRPVQARPESKLYYAGRFVRRYPTQVALALLAAVALSVGLVAALWQNTLARSEAARAERIKDFLIGVFEQADPEKTQGDTVTARELLALGTQALESGLQAEPAARADLYETLARVHYSLGLYPRASELAEQSLALRRETWGEHSLPVADALLVLGTVHVEQRDLDRGREALTKAAAIYEAREGADSLGLARAHEELGLSFAARREHDTALELQQKAVAVFERIQGAQHPDTATAMLNLAQRFEDAAQYVEAEQRYREALAAAQRTWGAGHVRTSMAHKHLAGLLDRVGRAAEASVEFERAIAIQRKVYGDSHPALASTLFSHSILLIGQRRFDEAEAALRDTLRIYPAGSYYAAQGHRYLGLTFLRQERYAEAAGEFELAVAGYRTSGPAGAIEQHRAAADMASAILRGGDGRRALPMLREAVAQLEQLTGPESYQVRNPLKNLGEALIALNQPAEATTILRRTHALEVKLFGSDDHRDLALTGHLLGEALLLQGGAATEAEARVVLDRALELQRKHQPPAALARTQLLSARLALRERDRERARRELTEALPLLRAKEQQEARTLLRRVVGEKGAKT